MQKVTTIINYNTYWPALQVNYFKQPILQQNHTTTVAEMDATSSKYLALEPKPLPGRLHNLKPL